VASPAGSTAAPSSSPSIRDGQLGLNPARLSVHPELRRRPDLRQARDFLDRLGLGLFLETIDADPASI